MKKVQLGRYLAGAFIALSAISTLQARTADEGKKETKKKETKYDKFFKDKKYDKSKSKFLTLYKMNNKVYAELPLKYLGKEVLIGATVSAVSDPTYVSVGMKDSQLLHGYFQTQDSVIVFKKPNTILLDRDGKSDIKEALELSYRDPAVVSYRIEAYNNDSTAVVLDMTSLLARPNSLINIVPKKSGSFDVKASPNTDLTYVKSVKAFDNNAMVKVGLNYSISATLMNFVKIASNIPTSVEATFSIMLLPEERMEPRIVDSRVGVNSTSKLSFTGAGDKSKSIYLAHRWNVVPTNPDAYTSGKVTKPTKNIVFYLDNTFPEAWREPIRQGVLRWNKAFEKAGFKDVIEVRDFPKNDKDFDPDNLQYSCIRYIPSTGDDISSSTWTDPHTGEIMSASIFVQNNIERELHKKRLVLTANVDPRVRGAELPKDLFAEALSNQVARYVGHTLGLRDNMAASSAYPTDSLRSATFTKKYGISPSIMDYVQFNYVAQPGDKGVRLTPLDLGVYDYYAIDWNYRYFAKSQAKDIWAQEKLLEAMVDKKANDPSYRFAPGQTYLYDPTALAEDLGNDPLKSSKLGIRNLQAMNQAFPQWIGSKQDEDSQKKAAIYLAIAQQYYAYIKFGLNTVGGIQVMDSKESSGIPRYRVVPKAKQREAFLWTIDQLRHFQGYANRSFERKGFINVSYYEQLLEYIIKELLMVRSRVIVASQIDANSYSLKEYFDDLYAETFRSTINGTNPTHSERLLQRAFVDNAEVATTGGQNPKVFLPVALTSQDTDALFASLASGKTLPQVSALDGDGDMPMLFSNPRRSIYPQVDIASHDQSGLYLFSALNKLLPILEKRVASTSNPELKAHYEVLLFKAKKALKAKK